MFAIPLFQGIAGATATGAAVMSSMKGNTDESQEIYYESESIIDHTTKPLSFKQPDYKYEEPAIFSKVQNSYHFETQPSSDLKGILN